jgi:hypothetical protein
VVLAGQKSIAIYMSCPLALRACIESASVISERFGLLSRMPTLARKADFSFGATKFRSGPIAEVGTVARLVRLYKSELALTQGQAFLGCAN